MSAEQIIHRLDLVEHPEGGWYREVYRAAGSIPQEALPDRFPGPRDYATHIYYLLVGDQVSHYHRIKSDELWHFYDGEALDIHMLRDDGAREILHLDREQPFGWVPADTWFAACVPSGPFALAGCSVSPGFDFADFDLGAPAALLDQYPDLQDEILRFT